MNKELEKLLNESPQLAEDLLNTIKLFPNNENTTLQDLVTMSLDKHGVELDEPVMTNKGKERVLRHFDNKTMGKELLRRKGVKYNE